MLFFRTKQQKRRRATPSPRPSVQPRLESLEDRLAPATFSVVNTNDNGAGSLRQAIIDANNNAGLDDVVFDSSIRGAINLATALPNLAEDVNILGNGADIATISRSQAAGTPDFGIFHVNPNVTVNIRNVTITNGKAAAGGGIFNEGTLTIEHVVVAGNFATQTGGGISNGTFPPTSTPILNVISSSIVGNANLAGGFGAGGINSEAGAINVINSTISNNQAITSNSAGGIGIYGGTALIQHSTISGNTASNQSGGGIDAFGGQVVIFNTIVAGNSGGGNADVEGDFTSTGHNLIGKLDTATGFGNSDLTGTIASPLDAKLGALQDNGGPTPTHALLAGSPAIDAGDNTNPSPNDQRGGLRIANNTIDIGAFEVQPNIATQIQVFGFDVINPGDFLSESVVVGAMVSNTGPPTGTVTVRDGNTPLGSISLSGGTQLLEAQLLTEGEHVLTFEYTGDGLFNASRLDVRYFVAPGKIWVGGDTNDGKLSTASNWRNGILPVAGDQIIFPANADGSRTLVNDLPSNQAVVSGVIFNGSGYDISGNQITLQGPVLQKQLETNTSDGNKIRMPIVLATGSGLFTIEQTPGAFDPLVLLGVVSGPGGITKQGDGILSLSGANTYQGLTQVDAGFLDIDNPSALGDTAAGTTVASGATLWLQSQSLTGAQTFAAEPLTLAGDGVTEGALVALFGDLTFPGSINLAADATIAVDSGSLTLAGPVGGSGGLRQRGSGILRLTQPATFTGTTTISEGVLEADSLPPTSGVVVEEGGTLAGTGTVGAVKVEAGGIISPGHSPGTIAATGGIDLQQGALYQLDVDAYLPPGIGFDQIKAPSVNIENATLQVMPNVANLQQGRANDFVIIDNQGTAPTTGQFKDMPEGKVMTIGGFQFRITYHGGTGNDVVLSQVGKAGDFPQEDQAFVGGVYQDLLGRAPDEGGQKFFLTIVTTAQAQAWRNVATVFAQSAEYRGQLVSNTYTTLLGRAASAGDVNFWVANIAIGLTTEQMIAAIAGSGEYAARQAGKDADADLAWLKGVYPDLLKRELDAGGQGFWLNALKSGAARQDVALQLQASGEARGNLVNQLYTDYLQRGAGDGDRGFWGGVLASQTREQVLAGIAGSQEAFQKSGNTQTTWLAGLYQKLLKRAPDAGGLGFFQGVLVDSSGSARRDTAAVIGSSAEHRGQLIRGWYTTYLARAASDGDVNFWVGAMASGATQQQVQAVIVGSAEYLAKAGGTNAGYLDKLYKDLLGRDRDPGSQAFLDALGSGTATREQIATIILGSSEANSRLVGGFYTKFLGRSASSADLQFWDSSLRAGARAEDVLGLIMSSAEYYQRPRS